MRKSTLAVMFIALAAWAYPIHAASALKELPQEDQIIINYELHHKTTETPQTVNAQSSKQKPSSPKPVPTSSGTYNGRHYSKEEVQQLIINYSQQYGIKSDTPLCIAKYESGYNQFSANKTSSARGVFQYISGTWRATDEGKSGLSVFDADANVKAAIKYMSSRKNANPWVVHNKCPKVSAL